MKRNQIELIWLLKVQSEIQIFVNMKIAIVLSACLVIALARSPPVSSGADKDAPIIAQDAEVNFDGSYHHSFQTGNGISAQEQGVLKNAGNKDSEAAEVSGSFEYTAPDGSPIAIQYVANEFGFQPQGNHLPVAPTPPPIPIAIQRALEWIAAHPQPQEPLARRQ